MSPGEAERTGELLIEEGIVTQEELARAIAEGGMKGTALAAALESTPHVRRAELATFLATDFRVPVVADLRQVALMDGLTKLVPEELARKHEMAPLARIGDILCVAKPTYFNRAAVLELRRLTGLKVKVLQADEAQVRALVDKIYRGKAGELPAPQMRKPETTAFRAQPPRVEERAAVEGIPLISQGDELPAGMSAEDVVEILDAVKIPSQQYASALRDPFARLVVEFDDVFSHGRAVAAARVV